MRNCPKAPEVFSGGASESAGPGICSDEQMRYAEPTIGGTRAEFLGLKPRMFSAES